MSPFNPRGHLHNVVAHMTFDGTKLLRFTQLLFVGLVIAFSAQLSCAGETNHGLAAAQSAYDRRDYVTAFAKWQELAKEGNVQAQYHVGHMILHAEGTNYDTREASQWLERAAKGGVELAQLELAELLASGQGVQKDEKAAAVWYEAAAKQGNPTAMLKLSRLYEDGKGVAANKKKATALLKSAAELGDPDAQFSLGLHYAAGSGIRQDVYKGYLWQTIAAMNLSRTDPVNAKAMIELRDAFPPPLSAQRKKAAEIEAQKWVARHHETQ